MGVEGNDRRVGHLARHRGHHNSMGVLDDVLDPHLLQLFHDQFSQFELPRAAGISVRVFAGGRINLHVLQETLEESLWIHITLFVGGRLLISRRGM